MSSYRPREKRGRLKLSKNLGRIYRESKCRDCDVVVTPMDFAKILGKFTKVKIQYENTNTHKTRQSTAQETAAPNSNTRLKKNENGMVLLHRKAYSQHPAKKLNTSKSQKSKTVNEVSTNIAKSQKSKTMNESSTITSKTKSKIINEARANTLKSKSKTINEASTDTPKSKKSKTINVPNNILKENNRLKKLPVAKVNISKGNNKGKITTKQYGIIFISPKSAKSEIISEEISLSELLPTINKNILPSEDWDIDYFPKEDEPKDDKLYNRIAAELDLMYSDETKTNTVNKEESEKKLDDFPSIMDILSDNLPDTAVSDKQAPDETYTKLESSDVEAMLLGDTNKTESSNTTDKSTSNVENATPEEDKDKSTSNVENATPEEDKDKSMSNVENAVPEDNKDISMSLDAGNTKEDNKCESMEVDSENNVTKINRTVSHIVFKQMKNGSCCRSVMCPKSLKYSIMLEGKSVELLGAPKFISSLEDLQVLLQIVNDTGLASCYVLH